MGRRVITDKKVIIISIILFLVIMYLLGIYNLNKRTAYKIPYNLEYGFRYQEKDGFFYLTGAAHINTPDIRVCVGKWEMDEEIGYEIEFSIEMRKHLLGKKRVYLEVYCSERDDIGDVIYFDDNFNYVFRDEDNIDYNKKLEDLCARHQDLIDELILQADILWDIR